MKKKAYLYLGLLGVGLMLGGLSALISKNVSETLAYELDCYDSTSTYGCPSGSTEIGKYCTTDGIDANSSSTCKGKGGTWIDDECYQTVDKIVKYSCPNGGELSSDKTQCCIKTQCAHYTKASCESAYSDITRSCTCTKDSDGCWEKSSCSCSAGYVLSGSSCIAVPNYCSSDSECGQFETCSNNSCVVNSMYTDCFDTSASYKSQCKSCIDAGKYWSEDNVCKDSGGNVVGEYTECDDYSSAGQSATKERCNSCKSNGGTWSFTDHTCTCKDGYTMTDGVCVKIDTSECDEESVDYKSTCVNCLENGKRWDDLNKQCVTGCNFSTDCDLGYYCSNNICQKTTNSTSCDSIYTAGSYYYNQCISCRNSGGGWDTANTECVGKINSTKCEENSTDYEKCICDEQGGVWKNNNGCSCIKYANGICYEESQWSNDDTGACPDGFTSVAPSYWDTELSSSAGKCYATDSYGMINIMYVTDTASMEQLKDPGCATKYHPDAVWVTYVQELYEGGLTHYSGMCIINKGKYVCPNGYKTVKEDGAYYCVPENVDTNVANVCASEFDSLYKAICEVCNSKNLKWDSAKKDCINLNTSSSTNKTCITSYKNCSNSVIKDLCDDLGGNFSAKGCTYEVNNGSCSDSEYTCGEVITKTSQCSGIYKSNCQNCISSNGKFDKDILQCVCPSGYSEDKTGSCVKSSSSNSSTKSGFYYLKNGECTEYPNLPGYCVEAGTLFYRNKLSEYTASNQTLSCYQAATAYFGQKGSGETYFYAQSELNAREYYTDSECKNAVSASNDNVKLQGAEWCNSTPSFDGLSITLKVGESITLTDTNGTLKDFDVSSSSPKVLVSTSGNVMTIKAVGEVSGATISMSKGSNNAYRIMHHSISQDYAEIFDLPLVVATLGVSTASQSAPDTYGGFKIIKKNSEGNVLSGVKFKVGSNIYGKEGVDWEYLTTDINGEIKKENIKTGTKYYYQEVETKEGYILDDNVYNLFIKENEIISIDVVNYNKGSAIFKLIKTDEGNRPLSGVKFKIGTNLNGKEGIDWSYMTTDSSGIITVGNIAINTKYYYQEVKTLEGYILDDSIKEIIIDEANKLFVKGEINYTDSSVTIIKKDANTGDVIRNVLFDVYSDKDDKLVYTRITGKDGKIVIQGIKNGKYYAKEKDAPDGYLLNKDKHYFEITDSNKHVTITITNIPDNPQTGSPSIYIIMIIGAICLGVSIYQYRKLKNVEFM